MKRENPGLSPGAPELSLILGSGPYGGVSGDGVPCSQRTNSSNISVGGWGCYPVRLTATFRAGALPYFHYAFGQRIRYFGIRTTTPLLLEVRPQMPSPRENGNQLGSSPRPSACRAIPSPCPPVSFGCSARGGDGPTGWNRTQTRPPRIASGSTPGMEPWKPCPRPGYPVPPERASWSGFRGPAVLGRRQAHPAPCLPKGGGIGAIVPIPPENIPNRPGQLYGTGGGVRDNCT
jgi:hypothetical protein